MDETEPRRVDDRETDDYRDRRRQITGDEVKIGVGKYAVTLRGGMVIQVVAMLAVLGLLGFLIQEQSKAFSAVTIQMSKEHRDASHAINQTLRMQTCVLSMSAEERVQWRSSRDAQNALFTYCPGLLMPAVPIP